MPKNITKNIANQIMPVLEPRKLFAVNNMLLESIQYLPTVGNRENLIYREKRNHKSVFEDGTILNRRHTLPKPINGNGKKEILAMRRL